MYQTQTVQDKEVASNEDFKTKELLGYSFLVKDPETFRFVDELELNLDWLTKEFKERVSGDAVNPGTAWMVRKEIWQEFIHDGAFSYTYSQRIGNQVVQVVDLLSRIPTSRHGIINIYDPSIDNKRREGTTRVPCTMYYIVFVRDGSLHMIYNIRSNDFNTHFPYDLVLARMLQNYIAKKLNRLSGDFIYQSGSLHAFYKDNKEIF